MAKKSEFREMIFAPEPREAARFDERPPAMELWSHAVSTTQARNRGLVGSSAMLDFRQGYSYQRPADIEKSLAVSNLVYLPLGILQWHGPDLPVGADLLIVEGLSRLCAERTGGLVWPVVLCGGDGARHEKRSFGPEFKEYTFRSYLAESFKCLESLGVKLVIAISGSMGSGGLQALGRAVSERGKSELSTVFLPLPELYSRVGIQAEPGSSAEAALVTWAGAWGAGLADHIASRQYQRGRDIALSLRQVIVEEARRVLQQDRR